MDTYWQTETGGVDIGPPKGFGFNCLKPGSAKFPMPGIDSLILDENGKEVKEGTKGYLVIKKPWSRMMININKNPEKYKEYFSRFPGFTSLEIMQ